MARTLHNSVTVSLHSQAHTWRRDLAQLERRHGKQYKAARAALQKKSETLGIILMKTEIMNSFMGNFILLVRYTKGFCVKGNLKHLLCSTFLNSIST